MNEKETIELLTAEHLDIISEELIKSTIENLSASLENSAAANSRIRDADIAAESSELAKRNIMLQHILSDMRKRQNLKTLITQK